MTVEGDESVLVVVAVDVLGVVVDASLQAASFSSVDGLEAENDSGLVELSVLEELDGVLDEESVELESVLDEDEPVLEPLDELPMLVTISPTTARAA